MINSLTSISVYIAGQVLKKSLATFPDNVGGQQALAEKKAKLIYAALDGHPKSYKVVPDKSVRSRMNICFKVIHVSHYVNSTSFAIDFNSKQGESVDVAEKVFLKQATEKGLTGLKGHRSVGGIRASNYNSIPLEGAEKLAAFLNSFATGPEA